jgi:hypothetical protein
MRNKKQIKQIIKNLKYFTLFPLEMKEEGKFIKNHEEHKIKRCIKEAEVINSLITATNYLMAFDSLDILENPKQEITKQQILHTLEHGEVDSSGITKYGLKMSKAQLDIYVSVCLELYGKEIKNGATN